jgi:type IV fimbrial biogenesis protein FimT
MDGGEPEQLLGDPQGRRMLRSPARQGGMTIVEIMVAIGIVAMVLALAGPSARNWIQNTQIRSGAESILGGVKQARFEAIKRNAMVAFELTDPSSTAWHVCLFDPVADACAAAQPDLAAGGTEGSQNARVGIETTFTSYATPLAAGSNVPSLVAFDSFGRVAPASPTNIARIEVRNPSLATGEERRLAIGIGITGQVVMCDPQLSKASNPQGCQ